MKLTLVRHTWGVDQSRDLEHHVSRWRNVGYEAIETSIEFGANPAFAELLVKSGEFRFIAQIFSNEFMPGGTVSEHLESLKRQVELYLPHKPMFFNAHSGSDGWSRTEAEDFYGVALELEKRYDVIICHETHRGRYFGTPWNTRPILETYPDLKLTCDLSHWVCVAERLLPDCADIIRLAAKHCHHLHARVGHEQGPQVSDPRAPEWANHLAVHEGWWDLIWASQEERGMKTSTLVPEFGPGPYATELPYTRQPIINLDDVCDWMARRQAMRFTGNLQRTSSKIASPDRPRSRDAPVEISHM